MLRRSLTSLFFVLAGSLTIAANGRADVTLAPVLGEGMVLQRGMPVRLWGTAEAGEKVTVSLQGQEVTATTGSDRQWEAVFKELKAGGPFELVVAGKNRLMLKDVLVGEVWLCSGQSNMRTGLHDGVPNNQEIIRHADDPAVRIFDLEGRDNGWIKCSPAAAKSFATVPYLLARDLRKTLNVPVGIVLTAVNGSNIEAWLHPDTLDAIPECKGRYQSFYFGPSVMSVAPMSLRGVAWYQGESNTDSLEHARNYRVPLAALIAEWRKLFAQQDLPFVIVQIAGHHPRTEQPGESPFAEVREGQRQVSLTVSHTALVVTTDVGEEGDIHPHNKEPIGMRVALAARSLAYEDSVEATGPVLEKGTLRDATVALKFTHTAGALTTRSGKVLGFCVAGADRKFVRADARIDGDNGDTVIVQSPAVPRPTWVRFGWADFPVVDLWNKAGLPASPFEATVE